MPVGECHRGRRCGFGGVIALRSPGRARGVWPCWSMATSQLWLCEHRALPATARLILSHTFAAAALGVCCCARPAPRVRRYVPRCRRCVAGHILPACYPHEFAWTRRSFMAAGICLGGCALSIARRSGPLYRPTRAHTGQPPLVLIPGTFGSSLRGRRSDRRSGRAVRPSCSRATTAVSRSASIPQRSSRAPATSRRTTSSSRASARLLRAAAQDAGADRRLRALPCGRADRPDATTTSTRTTSAWTMSGRREVCTT